MHQIDLTPRMQEAVEELKRLITERFPQAAFVVEEGFDPEGVYKSLSTDAKTNLYLSHGRLSIGAECSGLSDRKYKMIVHRNIPSVG